MRVIAERLVVRLTTAAECGPRPHLYRCSFVVHYDHLAPYIQRTILVHTDFRLKIDTTRAGASLGQLRIGDREYSATVYEQGDHAVRYPRAEVFRTA